jgi:enediyne biosynthesis protein E4
MTHKLYSVLSLRPHLAMVWLSTVLHVSGQAPPPTFTRITNAPVATDVGTAHGCAWVDYDNDGLLDLFDVNYNLFLQLPSYLYRNRGDGTFARITNGAMVNYVGTTVTGFWGDYDNDDLPDLFIPDESRRNFLYHNNGDGTFSDVTTNAIALETGSSSYSGAWADFDCDGNLDLFVTGGISESPQSIPGRNQLWRNNGNGSFTKITSTIVVNDIRFCLGTAWADYDNDGMVDLFVVKGIGTDSGTPNRLYRNLGSGNFARVTNGPIATDVSRSIGCAWGDYDNDGYVDLFVPCEFGLKSLLYHNEGNGTFSKITTGNIPNNVAQSLAAAWGDYDNDGFLDLFVANGRSGFNANYLYRNNGNGSFTQITNVAPVTNLGTWHGATWGDYDNDGFLDLFTANWGSPNALYRNNGNTNAWLKVKLRGTVSNRSGIGAKVRVKATIGGVMRWQMRQVSGGDGIIQNSIIAHFGLGDGTNVDVVRIEWPSGIVQELTNVMVNRYLTVREEPRLIPARRAGEFDLMGGKGGRYCIQATTNLQNWVCVGQLTNTEAIMPFIDTNAPAFLQRFYRAFRQ